MVKEYKSPAKINLLLKVTGERADGYHEIISIFQKISLHDTIMFSVNGSGKVFLRCGNPFVPVDERNLVIQAADALRLKTGTPSGAEISLEKNIPVAAGLGGGSSNAATTLLALNELWELALSKNELSQIATGLGADVPFFLNGPMALVKGIGEKVTELSPGRSLPLLLVNPGFGISAADAYHGSSFDFKPFEYGGDFISDMESGVPARIAKHLANDLQPWAFDKHPKLQSLKLKIENTDPRPSGVLISGSGPTLFAVYETSELCREAEKEFKNAAPIVVCVETVV